MAAVAGAASTEQEEDKALPAPAAAVGGANFCQAQRRGTALSMNAIVQTMEYFYIVTTAQHYQILQTYINTAQYYPILPNTNLNIDMSILLFLVQS